MIGVARSLLLFFLAVGAASAQELIGPADSTRESRSKVMWACLAAAQGKTRGEYSHLDIWDDLRKHVLKDDLNTGGFVKTTKLSDRSSPVVNADGNPSGVGSIFDRSSP